MSGFTLLVVLTVMVVISGFFLTSGWQNYLDNRRKRKTDKIT